MRYTLLLILMLYTSISWSISTSQRCSYIPKTDTLRNGEVNFFSPSPYYNKKRFLAASSFATFTYASFSIGFYNSWYKDFEMGGFRFFNDLKEWRGMDKGGHIFSGYFQSVLTYKGAKWTGLSDSKAIWTGIGISTLFQSTIEVMDGFSEGWGFSIPDIAANTIGVGIFAIQQKYYQKQIFQIKESAWPVKYSNTKLSSTNGMSDITLQQRALDLYGSSWGEKVLKDYNAQTYWVSSDMHNLLPDGNRWPTWLNLAIGYSAGNMYGGFENRWVTSTSDTFDASSQKRYSQFIVAPDINLTKIKTKSPFLKSLLSIGNIFKTPSPAIEINTRGQFIIHLLYY